MCDYRPPFTLLILIWEQDSSLLEFAWEELLDAKKDVNAVELAKVGDQLVLIYVIATS